jgi:hypothetical protein
MASAIKDYLFSIHASLFLFRSRKEKIEEKKIVEKKNWYRKKKEY